MFESRSRAAASVLAGEIVLLPERRRAAKPGEMVSEDVEVEVLPAPRFVSRGGIKLENALQMLSLDVADRRAIDIGSSTGGFTDCLLSRGARHVVAVDVGYGSLDWRLRSDPRVTVLERTNARTLRREDLPYSPEVIVIDVSFISLRKILPATTGYAAEQFDCLALVKPQFEVGRENVGKGGVVRSAAARKHALLEVSQAGGAQGWAVLGFASSGLPGPKGNLETFVWFGEGARGGLSDLETAIDQVEPEPRA